MESQHTDRQTDRLTDRQIDRQNSLHLNSLHLVNRELF